MKRSFTLSVALGLLAKVLAQPARAALISGNYQSLPGATVVERGDRVLNGSRVVPITASLTFELNATTPVLTAVISNAVLEGGAPFLLTVHSSSGARLVDGSYWFTGDYMRDLYPSGTQYGFDWRFSTSTNGEVLWSGSTAWWGGHLWDITISNLTVVPSPELQIIRAGSQIKISWPAAHDGFVLEQTAALPAANWNGVTNSVDIVNDRFAVTVEVAASQGYFRLRKL